MDNKEFRDIIEEIKKKEHMDFYEIAEKASADRTYISSLINNREIKMLTVAFYRKFQKAFPKYFPESKSPANRNDENNENVTRGTSGQLLQEEEHVYGKTRTDNSGVDTLMQAVLNLTESNKILASNNERLVTMLETNSASTEKASVASPGKNSKQRSATEQTEAFVGKSGTHYSRKKTPAQKGKVV